MTARTTAQRQAALRERRKKAGLMEVRGIWLKQKEHALLKRLLKSSSLAEWASTCKR